jgi:hypothetical protein
MTITAPDGFLSCEGAIPAGNMQKMARRIAAVPLREPTLDATYQSVKRQCYDWRHNDDR